MSFLDPMRNNKVNSNLLNASNNQEMLNSLTVLQNQIGVSFNTGVIVVTSIRNDELAASFAKALADTYAHNGAKALLLDANLYNPCLKGLLALEDKEALKPIELSDKVSAILMDKEIYPSDVYKSGDIQKLIEDNKKEFEHIIVLVPSVKEHKELMLLKEVTDAIILVAQKNLTRKESIYNAASFFLENKLPLAKTVVLK